MLFLISYATDPNYVNTFSLDFAFSFTITILIRLLIARSNNILLLIAFIISYRLFADKLNIQQSLLDRAIVVLIIILRSTPSTLLARFIPTTKIRNPLLKKNAAKSRILLACVDKQTRQCYLTICVILKHYNFNIYVSLATDTLHLLLKGLVIKMLDFITSLKRFNNKRAFTELIAIVSLLFILKAPFALHFIRIVCDLVILAQYKNIRMYRALDSICTRANSEAHYITIPYLTKLPLSKVAANIAISNFIHAAVVFSSSKRHNDSKHCDEKLYLILIIINYTCYDKDRKHIAYIRAFSKVLLFNNNRQINNTTKMLSVPFKFYDLSTIIRLVHLVLRDLPNLTTYTTMSYYVNNYIN
ncbi:hypothetical protein HBH86_047990 [Parastagonospora nodorum]|nr:hypothetical protein HBH93_038210 [Parastagonospora nodorum]KAH4551315.1 hypothetical protein HBH85_033150 [Parastagonospora nodorum]KAH4564417.1 hypothetical protein HBH86_047990 [Parastagonospora nodorum]